MKSCPSARAPQVVIWTTRIKRMQFRSIKRVVSDIGDRRKSAGDNRNETIKQGHRFWLPKECAMHGRPRNSLRQQRTSNHRFFVFHGCQTAGHAQTPQNQHIFLRPDDILALSCHLSRQSVCQSAVAQNGEPQNTKQAANAVRKMQNGENQWRQQKTGQPRFARHHHRSNQQTG